MLVKSKEIWESHNGVAVAENEADMFVAVDLVTVIKDVEGATEELVSRDKAAEGAIRYVNRRDAVAVT
jgi:hypothetical protein